MGQAMRGRLGRPFGVGLCFVGVLLVLARAAQGAGDGEVRRAWLGVRTKDVGASMQKMIGRDLKLGGDAGVIVAEVTKGGPAAQGGIRKNDLLVRVEGRLITSGRQLAMTVSGLRPGRTVQVTVVREMTVQETKVTLGAIGLDGGRLVGASDGGGRVEPLDDAPRSVTRYAGRLRALLARVQDVEWRFARAGSARAPQATIRDLGTELLQIGAELDQMFNISLTELTRFGTMEEAELVEAIRQAYEKAANALKAQAVAKLESAKKSGRTQNEMRQTLLLVGRELIEREAVKWMRKSGFEALLVKEGQAAMGREVSQGIELNLRTFLDKKSVELLGMPLGGFRSMRAAFRLQARRKIREIVADLVINFSGNQLVIRFLQRHVLTWVETDLWPKLREGFRPKTRLDRRVRISSETMEAASERLNRVSQGRRPAEVPLSQVMAAVDRAEGTLHAARYLERDLKRSGNQELMDDLEAAKRLLRSDIDRIRYQFLLVNRDRMEEIGDHLDFVLGVHEDVGKILTAMAEERGRMKATLQRLASASVREDVDGVMATIHEDSPFHTREAARRMREAFAAHTMVSDGFEITEVVKRSEQEAVVAFVERVGSSRQPLRLVMRRSGKTWKLYGAEN